MCVYLCICLNNKSLIIVNNKRYCKVTDGRNAVLEIVKMLNRNHRMIKNIKHWQIEKMIKTCFKRSLGQNAFFYVK